MTIVVFLLTLAFGIIVGIGIGIIVQWICVIVEPYFKHFRVEVVHYEPVEPRGSNTAEQPKRWRLVDNDSSNSGETKGPTAAIVRVNRDLIFTHAERLHSLVDEVQAVYSPKAIVFQCNRVNYADTTGECCPAFWCSSEPLTPSSLLPPQWTTTGLATLFLTAKELKAQGISLFLSNVSVSLAPLNHCYCALTTASVAIAARRNPALREGTSNNQCSRRSRCHCAPQHQHFFNSTERCCACG